MKNVTGLDLAKLVAARTARWLSHQSPSACRRVETERTVVLSGLNDASGKCHGSVNGSAGRSLRCGPPALTVTWKFLAGNCRRARRRFCGSKACRARSTCASKSCATAMSAFAKSRLEQPEAKALAEIRDVLPYADGTARPVWRVSVAPGTGHQRSQHSASKPASTPSDWQGGSSGCAWGWSRSELVRRIKALGGGHAAIRASGEARRSHQPFNRSRQWRCCPDR